MSKQTLNTSWTYKPGHSPHFQSVIWPEDDGGAIAVVYDDESEEKARLIAVAPELLAVLGYYVALHEKHRHEMPEINENEGKEWRRTLGFAHEVIFKATGQPHD